MTDDTSVWSADKNQVEVARFSHRQRRVATIIAIVLIAAVAVVFAMLRRESRSLASEQRPIEVKSDGYVSSRTCRECHPAKHQSWHASYHRTMTQVASPESVIGRFDGRMAQVDSLLASFHRRGDEFWVRQIDGWKENERRVVLTTGSHHMQVYWLATDRDRMLAVVPFVYLKEDQRWVPRRAVFLRPPGSPPSPEMGHWNRTCIQCHTTHGVPGFKDQRVDTTVAEFGIACEACHGPAEAHVRFHKEETSAAGEASLVDPAELSHERASEVCGQCHSARIRSIGVDGDDARIFTCGWSYRPGDDLSKTRALPDGRPEVFEAGFWPDGVVRAGGREYEGVRASPCFQRGELSCLSCHVMHKPQDDPRSLPDWANDQLGLQMDGNQACLQCHEKFGRADTLTAHTHHAPASSGSLCYNCHMPHTSYALLKAIRNHYLDSPSVRVSVKAGRPNACNLCHLDKTLAWTADYLNQWYDIPRPKLSSAQRDTSAALLWLLSGDPGQRVLAAWHMGWQPAQKASGDQWQAPFVAQLLEDPYDAVRYVAQRSLRTLPGFRGFSYDYVGGTHHFAEARQRAITQWHKTPKTSLSSRVPILLDEKGGLRTEKVLDLLRRRPNRPFLLLE